MPHELAQASGKRRSIGLVICFVTVQRFQSPRADTHTHTHKAVRVNADTLINERNWLKDG